MKARDYGEDLSKEGCARVVVYECSNIVHSYTLECGYHVYSSLNPVALLPKHSTPLEEEQLGPGEVRFFTPDIYANLGRNLLVSILDVWQRNSWSRI
jgi:cytosolic carboxypeptidase protein 5